MSGVLQSPVDMSRLVQALQESNKALYLLQQTLSTLAPVTRNYTGSTLPAVTSANQGQMAYVTNGRNSGEGAGSGTGCLVTVNSAGIWAAVWSGIAVTT
jgi:hypothetical protein